MTGAGGFEVEYDEAWAAGSALLQAGDDVTTVGRAGLLLAAASYGDRTLTAAAHRFADRYTHLLVQGLGEEAVDAGENLHATVREYRDSDVLAPSSEPTSSGENPL
ncbi:hypothetical protein [Actinotalea sp. JY-7885]|uniref:hypothetical protein n=1 Tax=Actinotalea sp. JY-7885 TaxID=2758576 RepID=UPI00165E775A|nr:hypothetical protein [Actinotalea sp. JY-7885]